MGVLFRIAIIGPESSGKTTLTEALAHHYRCAYTKEYARYYLEEHGPDYTHEDLPHIAQGQLMVEAESQRLAEQHGGGLVLCDTDMMTVRIWSEVKYGTSDPLLVRLAKDVQYDLRLLCRPDIPWKPDPLRENPHDRDRLFAIWERELTTLGLPYTIIEGTHEQRMRTATNVVDLLLEGHGQ